MASLIETPNSFRRRSEFYHQLSVLLQAGVGLTQSLKQIAPPSQRDGLHIRETIDRLNAGETFSETLIGREDWLPSFDRMMIEAGEAGGRLDDTLRILMPGVISYGSSLLGSGSASLLGAFFPSLLTLGALYTAVFFVLYLGQANRGFAIRLGIERIWHCTPMFGRAVKELKLSRLSFALYALLNAGVNIREAWESAASASGSPWLATSVRAWLPELDSGSLPSEALQRREEFPRTFRDLYTTGEVSGQLDESLQRLAKLYHDEGTRRLKSAAGIATGLVYGLVAITVAIIVIRAWLNYFNMFNTL